MFPFARLIAAYAAVGQDEAREAARRQVVEKCLTQVKFAFHLGGIRTSTAHLVAAVPVRRGLLVAVFCAKACMVVLSITLVSPLVGGQECSSCTVADMPRPLMCCLR